MADVSRAEPRNLVFLGGLLVGMSVEDGRSLGRSARSEAESSVGPTAAVALGWVVFIGWLLAVATVVRWLSRREWVRAWFTAAERWRGVHAEPAAAADTGGRTA